MGSESCEVTTMALTDYCMACGRPELEHTADELAVCWQKIQADADLADIQAVMAKCELCGERKPATDMLDHIRVMHPDQYGDGPERWPDGTVLIYEDPDEEDFGHA